MIERASASPLRGQRGVTLIELMIAITIALLILIAISWIFVGNSRARAEAERGSQQLENGSYAMQTLAFDLRMAGYWAEYNVGLAVTSGELLTPATLPDPCSTSLAVLRSAIPLAVQGYDADQAAGLTCISDRVPNTDVLVVRRVSGCVAGSANCAPVAGGGKAYFQASTCDNDTELESLTPSNKYRLDTDPAQLDRHKKNCTTLADQREVITHIYFVAANDVAGDGIPTLKRAEMNGAGWTIFPVAQGVENLQIEYGIDTSASPDRVPDVFQADPINYVSGAPVCTAVPCVRNFQETMAVNLYLLVRNPTQTTGYADAKSYTLGLKADGSANTIAATGDSFRRHVYTGAVRLINPSIR
jgi:type IV pilus assembly protein PilW